jgi:hypothetical protein
MNCAFDLPTAILLPNGNVLVEIEACLYPVAGHNRNNQAFSEFPKPRWSLKMRSSQ